MKIVCASSIVMGREAFSTLGDVTWLPERAIDAAAVRDADLLIIRSKVQVTRELLAGSRVAFVATATAGVDHMDLEYLAGAGIGWAGAPGCNADSVAEYVVAALLCMARRGRLSLEGRTMAIVGVGHVGTRVARLASALGLRVLLNDPPRQLAERKPELRPIDQVLPEADIVTLHVPLTASGPFATARMVDCRFLSQLKPGCVFINASRGEVVDEDCLLLALDQGWVSRMVLDVFEREPRVRRDVIERAELATPHIAGYSYEGRLRGTALCYEAACRFLEREPAWHPSAAQRHTVRAEVRGRSPEEALHALVTAVYDIEEDDRALRAGLAMDDVARARHFQHLRATYRDRFEIPSFRAVLEDAEPGVAARARALGFEVVVP